MLLKGKTNNGLVAYAKAQVGKPYWFGCFGQKSSKGLLASKRKQYPSYYTAKDFDNQLGVKVHDCIGLIKGYLWCNNSTSEPHYIASQDVNAKGMYGMSTVKGDMKSVILKDGVLLYKGSSYSTIRHVGIYCTDGYVYEAKGHAYGVVKTKFKSSDWNFWSMCPFIVYEDVNKHNKTIEEIADLVIAGKFGNGLERKKKVTDMGYDYAEIQKIVNMKLKNSR